MNDMNLVVYPCEILGFSGFVRVPGKARLAGNGTPFSRDATRSGARTNPPTGRSQGVPQAVLQRSLREQPLIAHCALLRNALKALNPNISHG